MATLAMLEVNPSTKVEIEPLHDGYGRTVVVRTVAGAPDREADAVYICAGDNPVFVANVIVLAHAHNTSIVDDAARAQGGGI